MALAAEVAGSRVIRGTREALHALEHEREVAIDLETSGLHPRRDKVAVVSLYGDTTGALAILHVRGAIPGELRSFLEDPSRRFSYFNGVNFDIPFLRGAGVAADQPPVYDALVGETTVTDRERHDVKVNLAATVNRRLGVQLAKDADHRGWMNPELTAQQVQYCAEDIVHIHSLRRAQAQRASETRQGDALEFEQAIVPTVAAMVYNGLPISLGALADYLETQRITEAEIAAELRPTLGDLNYGSAQQVTAALRNLGLMVSTTRAEYLQELDNDGPEGLQERGLMVPAAAELGLDPVQALEMRDRLVGVDRVRAERAHAVLRKIVQVRHAKKRQSAYSPAWQAEHVINGRVHSHFWQVGADTGRFTSSDPNLQQVPRDMRPVFGHVPGWKIVSVDYSQIEVVVAAYLASDRVLLNLIEQGGDIHSRVAARVFGIDAADVTPHQRKLAKAMSFCLFFGGGAATLRSYARRYGANLTMREAEAITRAFFGEFQDVARVRGQAYDLAKSGRNVVVISLPSGLKRYLRGAKIAPTVILNTTVQGSAAAGLKAGLRVARQRGLDMYLGATVHDELVACVPEEWAAEYAEELRLAMIEGMSQFIKAPVSAEAAVGDTWTD